MARGGHGERGRPTWERRGERVAVTREREHKQGENNEERERVNTGNGRTCGEVNEEDDEGTMRMMMMAALSWAHGRQPVDCVGGMQC